MSETDIIPNALAAEWQIVWISNQLELAKLNDTQMQSVRDKITSEMTYEQAANLISWLDQFIDVQYKSHKEMQAEILDKVNDPNT